MVSIVLLFVALLAIGMFSREFTGKTRLLILLGSRTAWRLSFLTQQSRRIPQGLFKKSIHPIRRRRTQGTRPGLALRNLVARINMTQSSSLISGSRTRTARRRIVISLVLWTPPRFVSHQPRP